MGGDDVLCIPWRWHRSYSVPSTPTPTPTPVPRNFHKNLQADGAVQGNITNNQGANTNSGLRQNSWIKRGISQTIPDSVRKRVKIGPLSNGDTGELAIWILNAILDNETYAGSPREDQELSDNPRNLVAITSWLRQYDISTDAILVIICMLALTLWEAAFRLINCIQEPINNGRLNVRQGCHGLRSNNVTHEKCIRKRNLTNISRGNSFSCKNNLQPTTKTRIPLPTAASKQYTTSCIPLPTAVNKHHSAARTHTKQSHKVDLSHITPDAVSALKHNHNLHQPTDEFSISSMPHSTHLRLKSRALVNPSKCLRQRAAQEINVVGQCKTDRPNPHSVYKPQYLLTTNPKHQTFTPSQDIHFKTPSRDTELPSEIEVTLPTWEAPHVPSSLNKHYLLNKDLLSIFDNTEREGPSHPLTLPSTNSPTLVTPPELLMPSVEVAIPPSGVVAIPPSIQEESPLLDINSFSLLSNSEHLQSSVTVSLDILSCGTEQLPVPVTAQSEVGVL